MAKRNSTKNQPVNNPTPPPASPPAPVNSTKIQEDALAIENDLVDLSVKLIENEKQREAVLLRIKKLRVDINKSTELDTDQAKRLLSFLRDSKKLIEKKNADDKKARIGHDATLKAIESQGDIIRDIEKTESKLTKILTDKRKKLEETEELERNASDEQKESLRLKIAALNADIKAAEILKDDLGKQKDIALMSDEEIKAIEEKKKKQDALNAGIEKQLGFLDTIASGLKDIPVVGDILYNMLDIDGLKGQITKKIGGSLLNAFGGASKGTAALEGGMAGATRGAVAFGTTLTVATGGLLLAIGAIVLLIKKMADAVKELDQSTSDIAKNLNMSKEDALATLQTLGKQGVLFENIVKYSQQLNENFGNIGRILLKDIAPRMQDLQLNMQLSDEEMSSLVSTAYLLGSSLKGVDNKASEFETTVANTTLEFYRQQGIQLTQGELANEMRATMQDIGKLTKRDIALYGRGTKELTKQVIAVRRLGLEFESVSKVMDKVLDIEQSLEQEMQTNILLGKHFNLNAVRAASLYGDVDDVAKSITESFEQQNIDLEEFNKMTPFRKKQLEELYGMQADEIQLMLLRGKLNKEELNSLKKAGKASADELKGIEKKLALNKKLSDEDVDALIREERKTTMAQDLAQIQAELATVLKTNMKGITAAIQGIADFGARVSDVGFARAFAGGGRTQAEQEADRILEENKKIEESKKIPESKRTAEQKELAKREKKVLTKEQADKATQAAETGFGTYLAAAATGGISGIMSAFIKDMFFDKKYQSNIDPTAGSSRPADDFVFRENGGLQTFSKGDLIMGIDENSLSSYSNTNRNNASENTSSTEAIALLKTQNELLGKLLQKVDQPVKMNIGGRVIEELDKQASLRRSYTSGIDQSFGVV